MSLAAPQASPLSGAAFTVGIAAARYNERLVDALLRQVCAGHKVFARSRKHNGFDI